MNRINFTLKSLKQLFRREINSSILKPKTKDSRKNKIDGRIIFLKKHLKKEVKRSWTVNKMAELIGVSDSYLHKLFKKEVGTTPIQYIRHLRLSFAKELLENTEFMNVQQICFQLGLGDPSQFSKDFKRKFGITPTEYRRNYWNSKDLQK